MSTGEASAPIALAGGGELAAHDRRARMLIAELVGAGALAAIVGASVWLAAGASGGRYLLEFPTRARPSWVTGPLHVLGAVAGPGTVNPAVMTLAIAYLLALACAPSIRLGLVLASVGLATLAFTLGPTIVSSDVFGYIAYARELAHGLNPYLSAPGSIGHDAVLKFVYWKHQTSPYGPLFTALSAPLGLTAAPLALWTYKALAGIAAITIAVLTANLARDRGSNPARAAIFVGLNPVMLLYAVSGAHNDLPATLLVLLAFSFALRDRAALGAGTAVAAAAVKLTLGLALPFVVLCSTRRAHAVRGAAVALLLIGVPALLLFGTHIFDQLQRIAGDPHFDIAYSGPDRLATALGTPIDATVRALSTAAAAGVTLVMLRRTLSGADAIAAAGWSLLALSFSIASLAPWYLVWSLPLAAIGRSRALRTASICATLYLIVVHLPLLGGNPWLSGPVSAR